MSSRPILVMAGGTGGHVYPALAVAQALQQRSRTVVWLGSYRGLESRIVPANNIDMEHISVRGLRGKHGLTLLLAPLNLIWAFAQSLCVMIRHRPAAVLGMGGFVSGPGGIAAWLMRRPLLIHEQNAVAGLTNRILARFARIVLQGFPGSFPSNMQTEIVGNPVRTDITALAEPAIRFDSREGPLRLLVLGGSQGALVLNKVIPAALARLPEELLPIVLHQTGNLTIEAAREAYEQQSLAVELVPYIEDMAKVYAWADLVVCRAGALTVAELSAAGLAAIFVPYAIAVDDHQTANAKPMVEAGAAVIIAEADLCEESLADLLKKWLISRDELKTRATKARSLAKPDALNRITDLCLELAGTSS